MTKRINHTKHKTVRFRATPEQDAEFKRRGGAKAGRAWLDTPTGNKTTPLKNKDTK